ncbi:phage tail tape measure protein [Alicycliphilus denitrificans]|uniref:phage tail tape measure protein n=1 Tax=Alicycliphilus denitrificans TaxID=179636 RepID=UPI0001D9FEAE|nr:phage tail tape measure protein [Alicycliphilus denitrificans]ADU99018.1 phage tail tape measure protein, TP901 family [Alicycliphilus denitrificans BC]
MAVDSMRLRVVLDLAERVVAPLQKINGASREAASALKATRDRLKELNTQQRTLADFGKARAAMSQQKNSLQVLRQQLDAMRASGTASTKEVQAQEKTIARQTDAYERQRGTVFRLRTQLTAMGVNAAGQAQRRLASDIATANAAMAVQQKRLEELNRLEDMRSKLAKRHSKEMMHLASVGGFGVAAIAAGRKATTPLRAAIGAFMPAESEESQLRASMMGADGSVSAEYQRITDLATRLGDKLPGTTADFIQMMTMLRRQGISAQAILGGLGEASAYLGVQLKMPVTAAAEFGAKMQDATQTAERDMMGLMDVIQRTYYLGVDSGNMLQGFTKLSPVLGVIGKKGLEGARELAPLLVMMDQTGMAGESAGNAIRKVYQAGLDAKKMAKGNALLASAGISLDFTDGKGEFAGTAHLFAQLDKLQALTAVQRTGVIKAIFGDDAETLQVLNTMMAKGMAGYDEVVAKMQAQADLRRRVNEQLQTLGAVAEAAEGSFTNMLKDMGATIAPDLKRVLTALADLANATGAWVREHPELVKWAMRAVGVAALLVTAVGGLALAYAGVLAPVMLARFALGRLSLAILTTRAAATAAAGGMGLLYRVGFLLGRAWAFAAPVVAGFGQALMVLGRFLLVTPLGFALTLLATAGYLLYTRWAEVKGGAIALWQDMVALKDRFFTAGADLLNGLVNGITSRAVAVRDAVVGMADAVGGWFREKLGINSPSRVFMQYGGWIADGAAIGMQGGQGTVRNAALAIATAATAAGPGMAGAGPVRFDSRPPLSAASLAAAPAPMAAGSTYHITINAAPGMDGQAVARAVAAELDRRERQKSARVRSQLSDID